LIEKEEPQKRPIQNNKKNQKGKIGITPTPNLTK
jgi:hypothetical protein